MRFRTVVIAALILVLATVSGLVAFQMADEARGEAAQTEIDRTDTLAVEPDIRQHLASDIEHNPTGYHDEIDVELDDGGGTLQEGDDYEWYPETGEIEFLIDEDEEANINYTYRIPEDQVADEQLTTITDGYGTLILLAVGLSFVVLFLFIGGYVAKKVRVGNGVTGR